MPGPLTQPRMSIDALHAVAVDTEHPAQVFALHELSMHPDRASLTSEQIADVQAVAAQAEMDQTTRAMSPAGLAAGRFLAGRLKGA